MRQSRVVRQKGRLKECDLATTKKRKTDELLARAKNSIMSGDRKLVGDGENVVE